MVGTLEYLRMKIVATLYRLLFRIAVGSVNAKPDEVMYIDSRDAGRKIKVHVYRPAKAKTPSPVLINWHGSGFMLAFHGSDDNFCRYVADHTDYTVLDCAYRLAPEHPFPATQEDAADAINWVMKRGDEYDLENLAIGGFSAGGHTSLVMAGETFPPGTFAKVISIYPATDMATPSSQKTAVDTGGKQMPVWTLDMFKWALLQNNEDLTDKRLSPENCDLERFPQNIFFVTAAQDRLGPETEVFAEKLKARPGSQIMLRRMDGCHHAWDKSPTNDTHRKATDELNKLAVEFLTS